MSASPSVMDQLRLDGRSALVTGGAQGLGRAISVALAEAGADLVVLDRLPESSPEATALRTELEARRATLRYRQVDLVSLTSSQAEELIAWARGDGDLSVLVNNAGIVDRGPAVETSEPDWRRVIDLDLTVPFLLSQAFARRLMAENRPGNVINLGSINSFQGGIEVASYAAAKHGLLGLTKALANEWTSTGITVNAIAPGYMRTQFTQAHRADPERYATMSARIPAERWGEPADIAGAAVFLASRASAYVTGTTLTVDGGWLGR
ncbi:MAG TPA: SDR family oxidoreductase [Jiangellaceae bacterium]